jgi:hypothetical protein
MLQQRGGEPIRHWAIGLDSRAIGMPDVGAVRANSELRSEYRASALRRQRSRWGPRSRIDDKTAAESGFRQAPAAELDNGANASS